MDVLVTGVTGYIGGRLVPRLLGAGHRVRVLVRDPERLQARPWADGVAVFQGSVEEGDVLGEALRGVDVAYYLVQSMCAGPESARRDLETARIFSAAAEGLPQLVHLSSIPPGPRGRPLPPGLRLRAEIGRVLSSSLPTTEVRAGPIIGSGSASFELLRGLTERYPTAIGPRWIKNPVQPIAVRDLLSYLAAVAGRQDALGVLEVGAEPITFQEMMREYARERGMRRVILALPVSAPNLSRAWARMVTPLPGCLAGRLVRGMAGPVLGDTHRSERLFPDIRPMPFREALRLALKSTEEQDIKTRWSDALGRRETPRIEGREGTVKEVRTRLTCASPDAVFKAVCSLGGDRGWLFWNWAWRLRGAMDKVVGGPGLRRGRRDPVELLPGEAVDFWRVEEVQPPRFLRLRAEMKVPGEAWLQWEVKAEEGGTRIVQTALFEPRGLFGWIYWYGSYPAHQFIFDGLVDAIKEIAEDESECNPGPVPAN